MKQRGYTLIEICIATVAILAAVGTLVFLAVLIRVGWHFVAKFW